MEQIKVDIPNINILNKRSDNVKCYHNKFVIKYIYHQIFQIMLNERQAQRKEENELSIFKDFCEQPHHCVDHTRNLAGKEKTIVISKYNRHSLYTA